MTDLPFDYGDSPATPTGATGKECRRHDWVKYASFGDLLATDGQAARTWWECLRCGKLRDEATSRRGRTNRSRGNAIEREVAKQLGLRRVGQFGGPTDVEGSMFAGQVKSGASFPERLWGWLRAVPAGADQTRILIVTDAPGPGHRRRAVVVLELEDWKALHGETVA